MSSNGNLPPSERAATPGEILHGAADTVASTEGDAVFRDLVRYLAHSLAVDVAFIALPLDADPARMRMLAFYVDGRMIEDFEYPLAGTPCETVMGQRYRLYPSRLTELFPQDLDFRDMGLQCYAGYPLNDVRGSALGLIGVAARQPFASPMLVESILKIFAARALAELERARADRALRLAEESYRAIFDAAEDAIFVHDWDSGAIVDANPKACEAYGYTKEEFRRTAIADLGSGEPPYTGTDAARWLDQAKREGTVELEWRSRNRDGTLHWDEVRLKTAVLNGKPHILAFTRDITARKQAEAASRQAQKMEAIGHLSGGIAHDFNNILTSILGYLALAAERPAAQADPKLVHYLEQARNAGERARDLIRQMLTFSRGQRGEPRAVDLCERVGEAVKLLRSTLPSTVEMATTLERDLPSVWLDPVHLEQVLLNLCINARDAMEGVGKIRITLDAAPIEEAVCSSCRQRVQGSYVALSVADSGCGIAAEVMERMFEPFFTTKEVGKGSGMGLATVHGIVHEYGGHICVQSCPENGATFRVLWPPMAETEVERRSSAAAARVPRRRLETLQGRVLVVDDDAMVAELLQEMLTDWGITVILMQDPLEALEWFTRDPAGIDLMLTDYTMPKLTGVELAQRMAEIRPGLPVVLYTGYGTEIDRAHAARTGIGALLAKPVDPHTLFEALRRHLPPR